MSLFLFFTFFAKVNSDPLLHPICVPLKVSPRFCSLIVVSQSSLKQLDGCWQQEQQATEATEATESTRCCSCTSDSGVVKRVGIQSRSPPRTLTSCTHPAPWAADVITCSHERQADRELLLKQICIVLCAITWKLGANIWGSYLHPGNPHRCPPGHFSTGCSWSSTAWSAVGWSCLALWCQAPPLDCWSDWLSHHPSPLEDT